MSTSARPTSNAPVVAHLTTVDMSLRFLVLPQLLAVRDLGGTAIGISAPGPWASELERQGIRHLPLHSSTRAANPFADLRSARELGQILEREQIDVLHTHNPKPGLYGRVVGRLRRTPIVVNTVHGLYAAPDDPLVKRALVYGLEGIASRCSDAELFQNEEDLALLQRLHLTRHARLLGNGVDLDRFDPSRFNEADRRALRHSLSITDDDTVVIGAVGRLVAEKGYPELFDAVAMLPRDRYRLMVVGGDDPDKPDALDRATVTRARDQGVIFLGHRDEVEQLYAAMDVFVLASHREGFPRAAMEASAMGVPVVATDIRGCRQVVDPEVTGLLVPVRDSAALSAALCALGDDAPRRLALGSAGRARALAEFDERRVIATVLDTYSEVARRKAIDLTF